MPEVQPQVVNIDLTNGRTIDQYIVQPGTQMQSIYVASMPAGATIFMAFDQKLPFQIYPGWSMDVGACNFMRMGVSVIAPALAGQVLQFVFVPFTGGSGSAFTNAG